MQAIEKDAKEIIRHEVAAATGDPGNVRFKASEAQECRAEISWAGKQRVVYFRTVAHHNKEGRLKAIKGDVRHTLREMGAIKVDRVMREERGRRNRQPATTLEESRTLAEQVFSTRGRVGTFGAALKSAVSPDAPQPEFETPEFETKAPAAPEVPNRGRGTGKENTMADIAVAKSTQTSHMPPHMQPQNSPGKATSANAERRVQLSHKQALDVLELLIQHGTTSHVDAGPNAASEKFYTFDDGWDDARIRDIVRPEAKVSKVAEIRRERLGHLSTEIAARRKTGVLSMAVLKAENDELREDLAHMRKRMTGLEERIIAVEAITEQWK